MTKVWEWDWINELITEYERKGECNQCGQCCTATIVLGGMYTPNDKRKSDRAKIWYEIYRQLKPRAFWRVVKITAKEESTCSEFDNKTRKCLCNGDKKLVCMDWPFSLEHQKYFPDCGYGFEKIRTRTFEEQRLDDDNDNRKVVRDIIEIENKEVTET